MENTEASPDDKKNSEAQVDAKENTEAAIDAKENTETETKEAPSDIKENTEAQVDVKEKSTTQPEAEKDTEAVSETKDNTEEQVEIQEPSPEVKEEPANVKKIPEVLYDVKASIQRHIALLKPWFPKTAFVCVGEYPVRVLLKGRFVSKTEEALPVFVGRSSKDIKKWSLSPLDEHSVLGLDEDIEAHFWFDALDQVSDDSFIKRLKHTSINKVHEAVVISSTWDGFSSALLPTIIAQSKGWSLNSVALVVLPSKVQPPDSKFNTFSCLGMCVSKDFTPLLLLDRDQLEGYVGVDRQGSIITGNAVLDYVLEMLLAKETFVAEMYELLKSFNARMCGVLAVTGASFKLYGSLENVLSTMLVKPLTEFDLPSASLVYVLVRMPLKLKDKLSKGKIELAVADWFSKKADLRSVYISEPIYVDDALDRIDLVMVVGGFNTTKMFASLEKEVSVTKEHAIENGFIKKAEWQAIAKSLA